MYMVEYIALSSTFEVVTRLMFPLLNTASRPLSTCFRSNCFDFDFPCIRFRFPDRALPFPYPFPNKNMKMKVVRVFSRSFPTAFIPRRVDTILGGVRPAGAKLSYTARAATHIILHLGHRRLELGGGQRMHVCASD